MKLNGTTVPSYRDDTYDTTEVHRKSYEELYDTSFNKDQKEVLDNFESSGGGGASLPEVTVSDNGMVLTVVEGEWDKAAGGGGAEPLIVNATFDSESLELVLDKTFAEIAEAFKAGSAVTIIEEPAVSSSGEPVSGTSAVYAVTRVEATPVTWNIWGRLTNNQLYPYVAESADDYPKYALD